MSRRRRARGTSAVPTRSQARRAAACSPPGRGAWNYLDEVRPTDARAYTRAELRRRGYSFLLDLSEEGPKGTHLHLRWALYDADGGRVPGRDYAQVSADFTTSATRQDRTWPVWVPHPPRQGRYLVRFTLEDEQRRPVDQAQSQTFAHRAG